MCACERAEVVLRRCLLDLTALICVAEFLTFLSAVFYWFFLVQYIGAKFKIYPHRLNMPDLYVWARAQACLVYNIITPIFNIELEIIFKIDKIK